MSAEAEAKAKAEAETEAKRTAPMEKAPGQKSGQPSGQKAGSKPGQKAVPKARKIPMRQCLGCNQHKPKAELLRVVRTPEGETVLDFTGKKSGRGAYICRDVACLRRVRKSHRLERSLDCSIPDTVYDRMEAELSNQEEHP